MTNGSLAAVLGFFHLLFPNGHYLWQLLQKCFNLDATVDAVAPEPVRVREAEEMIRGRTVDEQIAEKATGHESAAVQLIQSFPIIP